MKKILSHLMMLATMMAAITTFTSCEEEDDYIAQQLRVGDWQGYIGAYYSDRWGVSGDTYRTVMRFESRGNYYTSGRGYELNYSTRNPHRDYACSSFKWFIVDGEITLLYDDDMWSPVYIIRYSLGSTWFRGTIYDGSNRNIRFEFENMAYDDWGYYRDEDRYGGYGDFSHQNWYLSRSSDGSDVPCAEPADVPLIDRSDIARQRSGDPQAVSVVSGEFARAAQRF